jgi:hypothetical protein
MLDNLKLEESLRLSILNLMLVLYDCGISEIHLGGLMRLLGVDNAVATAYDEWLVKIDEDVAKYIEALNEPRPSDQTLH